jgi:putative Mn2+ efflux pump MntP
MVPHRPRRCTSRRPDLCRQRDPGHKTAPEEPPRITFCGVLALLVVAVSVGLDNFGASVGIGVTGIDRTARLRIALVFGVFEAAMPVIGLLIGHSVARRLGTAADPVGGVLLGLAGSYIIFTEVFGNSPPRQIHKSKELILIAAALSIDNLVIGFALGTYRVEIALAAVVFATVSVALTLTGLEIGDRIGEKFGSRSELIGGVALIIVGVAIGAGLL